MKSIDCARKVALAAVMTVASISVGALGCSAKEATTTSDGSGGADGGGADGGHQCTWDGTGGGTTIPDCSTYINTAHLVGTLDGMPYEEMFRNIVIYDAPNPMTPQDLDVDVPPYRLIHLEWPGPTVFGQWIDVTGSFVIPLEKPRAILPGSKLRRHCRASLDQYILIIEGGTLTACSAG